MALHRSALLLAFLLLLLHPLPSHAQQSSNPYSPPTDFYRPNFSATVAVVIVVMVSAFFAMVFFSLYLRRCAQDPSLHSGVNAGARSRTAARRGLDKSILETFPSMVYSEVKELRLGRTSLECAVCLCEFEDAETLRILPKCSHAFHTDCIDMWLDSHSTCPVCRADLAAAPAEDEDLQPPMHVAISVEENTSDGRVWAEDDRERFTLRLPEEVRKEVMGRRLDRSATMALTKGNRGGWSFKREWAAKSDRWAFLGRTWSLRTPRGKGEEGSGKDEGESSTAAAQYKV